MSKSFCGTPIFIVSLLSLLCVQIKAESNVTARIVGGQPTTIKKVPYLVRLIVRGRFECGGTLISRKHVVTAAHCVKGVRPKNIKVIGGSSKLREAGSRRSVKAIYLSRKFNLRELNMDVALLKLGQPMTGNATRPIGLCSKKWRPGLEVRVSGWGLTGEKARSQPNTVRTMKIPLIGKRKCVDKYRLDAVLTKSMICAAVPGRKDSCTGDSGGPLVFGNELCGVVSWGFGCAEKSFPGIYTSIKVVKSFLLRNMKK